MQAHGRWATEPNGGQTAEAHCNLLAPTAIRRLSARSFSGLGGQRRSSLIVPLAYGALQAIQDNDDPPKFAEVTMPRTAKARQRRSMTGATAASFHEGSRSEILADYLFSAWGTVTPARRQSDYGLDLYCTLTERVGQCARVQEYFSVQVKSGSNALWSFNDISSVKWLVEHPQPLFLSTIDKKRGTVRVYHTIPRFQIWALGPLPDCVEFKTGGGTSGQFDPCDNLPSCSLSAPILDVGLSDLTDEGQMKKLKEIFAYWVGLDRDNCELVRAGLLRFRRPHRYETNKMPSTDTQLDLAYVDDQTLKRGLRRLAEGLECIGGQLSHPNRSNYGFGLELLLDRIQKEFPDAFKGNHFWRHRVPGWMGTYVLTRLNQAVGGTGYHYSGLDAVEGELANIPLVKRYLARD